MNADDAAAAAGHAPLPPDPGLPDAAAADARWQQLLGTWVHLRDRHRAGEPGRPFPGVVPLLETARAHPRLRPLHPFTSHFTVLFSSRSTFPYLVRAAAVTALHDGRFRILGPAGRAVLGHTDTAEAAVALVVAGLPDGPA